MTTRLPEGPEWLYEVKFDGYRALVIKSEGQIRIYSRKGNDLTKDFPGIAAGFEAVPGKSWIIDGEIVALNDAGRPDFQALQNRAQSNQAIVMYAFDLLHLDGADLMPRALSDRRRKLEKLLTNSKVRLSPPLVGSADEVMQAVRKLGLEGVVAKRLDSAYSPGERSQDWLKQRIGLEQEFVIGGYRPAHRGFESLLVGFYEAGTLLYAGNVRSGFNPLVKSKLKALLKDAARCPFANLPESRKGRWGEGITAEDMDEYRWVRPQVVVQIKFASWANGGHLRHASYVGLRPDKTATDVRRE